MSTRETAYVAVDRQLPAGGVVTADFYALWPQGASTQDVEAALASALDELREQVATRAK